ncbi:uncharacterized protein A4U43_C10F15310 [Asparagus officinalis]|uniref:F-box domain-containing protein n=1 Tax=Asparagus officinalis TaxID=4686 RepID=A0A5P1E358_ASPOF|nr:F-box/kelch-repeat protein SKIP4-like [Asparagus officinalis]ONK56980.1 uncharacterized protein A4U43_C10F15310 [Asparagus officinalis]
MLQSKQAEESFVPLFCGLPDDLSLLCLAKVPRRYHHVLRCVSKRWRAFLSSEEWHFCRGKYSLEEAWIYAMCRDKCGHNCLYVLDPERHSWKHIDTIPSACLKRLGMSFEASGKKLYLLGGGDGWDKDCADDVFCYDPSAERWKEAARMPTDRCFFLSAAVDNKIFVTAGTGSGSPTKLKEWDIYDPISNSWRSESNPMPISDRLKSTCFNGKIYTFHKTWYNKIYARVYDPLSKKWEDIHKEIASCQFGPMVIVDGTLYMLDETSGTRLMIWDQEYQLWVPLARLSLQLTRPPCQLAAIGRKIFIIGTGLSTVVVDVDMAVNARGILVTSSFAPRDVDNVDIVGCKAIAI